MTISNIEPVNNHTGNNSATTFEFDFLIKSADELKVTRTNSANVQTVLVHNIDYSINEIGNKNGSYITFPLGGSSYEILATNEAIKLELDLKFEQQTEFQSSQNLSLPSIEEGLDYQTRLSQILKMRIDNINSDNQSGTQASSNSSLSNSAISAINGVFNYFQNNKGSAKPNAANADGIPYHAKEAGYHWQIHENSTTSECVALLCRAMVEAGYLDYAKILADFIINNLTYDNLKTVHWLINLVDNGVEMETEVCGAYDSATFAFVNGIATIPAGAPYYGENVTPYTDSRYNGVRACYSTDAVFNFRDYFLEPESGTKYEVDSYSTSASGTTIVLKDTSFSGDLQVFYNYRNENMLDKNELYRSYPVNTACVVDGVNDYQISVATDGVQWAIVALKKLAVALGGSTYSDYADDLQNKLIQDSTISSKDLYLYDATNRSLYSYAVATYEETPNRNLALSNDGEYTKFSYDAGANTVSWSIGTPQTWTTGNLEVSFRGDGNVDADGQENIKQIAIEVSSKTYYRSIFDNNATPETLRTFTSAKTDFCSIVNIIIEAGRGYHLTPYSSAWNGASGNFEEVEFSSAATDSQGVSYDAAHRFSFNVAGAGSGVSFGQGVPSGVVTEAGDNIKAIVSCPQSINALWKIIDNTNTTYTSAVILASGVSETVIDIDTVFVGAVHPIKNFEIVVQEQTLNSYIDVLAVVLNEHDVFASNTVDVIKFETRTTLAGSFDIGYAKIPNANPDIYAGAGAALFTLEYSEDGLLGWRSGTYPGYTNPYAFENISSDIDSALNFLENAQNNYNSSFSKLGPFTPVYLRNLGENKIYGTLGTWGWNGPDPNTIWAGFQYRAISNIADLYYFAHPGLTDTQKTKCSTLLANFFDFLNSYIEAHSSLPSTFNNDGSVSVDYQSPDFYALVGRSALLKYEKDKDVLSNDLQEFCLTKLLDMQQEDGSFKGEGQDTYGFHQAEALIFLAEIANLKTGGFLDGLTDNVQQQLDGKLNTSGGTITGQIFFANLPTADPGVVNQLWNDNGTLKISAG